MKAGLANKCWTPTNTCWAWCIHLYVKSIMATWILHPDIDKGWGIAGKTCSKITINTQSTQLGMVVAIGEKKEEEERRMRRWRRRRRRRRRGVICCHSKQQSGCHLSDRYSLLPFCTVNIDNLQTTVTKYYQVWLSIYCYEQKDRLEDILFKVGENSLILFGIECHNSSCLRVLHPLILTKIPTTTHRERWVSRTRRKKRGREGGKETTWLTMKAQEVLLPIVDLHCCHCVELIDPHKGKSEIVRINQLWT